MVSSTDNRNFLRPKCIKYMIYRRKTHGAGENIEFAERCWSTGDKTMPSTKKTRPSTVHKHGPVIRRRFNYCSQTYSTRHFGFVLYNIYRESRPPQGCLPLHRCQVPSLALGSRHGQSGSGLLTRIPLAAGIVPSVDRL